MNVPCGFANFAIDPLYSSLILNGADLGDADFVPGTTTKLLQSPPILIKYSVQWALAFWLHAQPVHISLSTVSSWFGDMRNQRMFQWRLRKPWMILQRTVPTLMEARKKNSVPPCKISIVYDCKRKSQYDCTLDWQNRLNNQIGSEVNKIYTQKKNIFLIQRDPFFDQTYYFAITIDKL